MKLLKASDLEVISGAQGEGDCTVFYPVDIQVSWGKIASREDLEPHFFHFQITPTVTKTHNFVALKPPEERNLNTKAVFNDLLY